MAISPYRWKVISPSRFPWEQEALDYVRQNLGSSALYAWSNFEFIALSGALYEVDLLVLTTAGLYLVEIKSWPGTLHGDAYTWILEQPEGKSRTFENPLFLANRKSKEFKSLLSHQKSIRASKKPAIPFIQPLVFLSSQGLKCGLKNEALQHIYLRESTGGKGILGALTPLPAVAAPSFMGNRVDRMTEKAIVKAIEEAGIKPQSEQRQIGDYLLGDIIGEGPGYQDRVAKHCSVPDVVRRIRQYLIMTAASNEERLRVGRAARRDFQILENINHSGIVRPLDFKDDIHSPVMIFEHHPHTLRLDHYLEKYGERLDLWARLQLVRQIPETLLYMHNRKILHRALSPQCILIYYPDSASPSPKIMNWHTGRRDDVTSGTSHIQELIENISTAYIAPECITNPRETGEYSDVFSLGALSYHLLSGSAPARSYNELFKILQEHSGLHLSSKMDGVCSSLDELIRWSTHPDVNERLADVGEFLKHLEDAEDELTAPDQQEVINPLNAAAGDRLAGDLIVQRRLGRGSIAVALEVQKDGKVYVLKLAQDPAENARLREEAEVLGKVQGPHIVELCDVLEIGDLVGLLLSKAGEKTLAQRLKEEGPLHLDLLQRFGDDLLKIISFIESKGIPHRDIKPSNLGVSSLGKDDALHLILFDFSLSRAPLDNIRAGTPQYLDPFLPLRNPQRWDLNAERYAAGVTLYEMAAGVFPRWGDGRSDPALVEGELHIEPERFDPSVRDMLRNFFLKALNRDFGKRFDNAEEMRLAWRDVFCIEEPSAIPQIVIEKDEQGTSEEIRLETPIEILGLSPAAKQALDRIGIFTVKDLLGMPPKQIRYLRGVGNRTRKEISTRTAYFRTLFPIVDISERELDEIDEITLATSIDSIAHQLIDVLGGKLSEKEKKVQTVFLGSEPLDKSTPIYWPSQSEIGIRLHLNLENVAEILKSFQTKWQNISSLALLIDDIEHILKANGGIMTARELSSAVLGARGSILSDPIKRITLAGTITRVAIELDQIAASSRFRLRRSENHILIALSDELANVALQLGQVADELAKEDPLASPSRALEELMHVRITSEPLDMTNSRLMALAAEVSSNAALSSRQEFYPRGMGARRALILAHGALIGDTVLKVEEVKRRVSSRYPEAEPLPERPELDDLLKATGWDFYWSDADGAYCRKVDEYLTKSSSRRIARLSTTMGTRSPVTPEVAEARQFEERLTYAYRGNSFLILMIDPHWMIQAEKELSHRFDVESISLDELLIDEMKATARKMSIQWEVVLKADSARGTRDWVQITRLVKKSLPGVEKRILERKKTPLIVNPGLLARYDHMQLIENLRDKAGCQANPGIWVLVPCDEQNELPVLDGKAVPLLSSGQRVRIPGSWLRNVHRS